jgi:threonine/homoserine/homoserine lactone efflux protein
MTFTIIKYLGAAYMFYLAFKAIKEKQPIMEVAEGKKKKEKSLFQHYRKGFLMNVLNPKVSLFFIAFLPQFVSSQSSLNITWQMIILGFVFIVQTIIIFSLIALLSGKLTKYLNSPKFWKITKWSKVSVLCVLGLTLVLAKK